jgi:cell division protein ZapA (FtsZ GTPase activity inhibitor)
MIDATLEMLRARADERVAVVGVVAALFCDDLPEAVTRLENCRDSAREHARSLDGRRQRSAVAIAQRVASVADDLLPPVRQLAKRQAGR